MIEILLIILSVIVMFLIIDKFAAGHEKIVREEKLLDDILKFMKNNENVCNC